MRVVVDLSLKEKIMATGMKQYAIAQRAGLDNWRLSRILNGHLKPSRDELRALAQVIDCDYSELNGMVQNSA